MEVVVLIIHLLVCICLIGLVLLQRSEGGALGMGGGGGALMSGRGAADALAKMTQVAGGFFLVTSISLTLISGAGASASGGSVFDRILPQRESTPTPAPAPVAPDTTPDPTESSAPEAADTQLALAIVPAPPEVAPAPVGNVTRAAPIAAAAVTPPPARVQRPTPAAASGDEAAARRPPAPVQRSAPATTPEPTRAPLVIPDTSGGVSGVTLTDDPALQPESIEIGNGVEAVRRERAGPDQ